MLDATCYELQAPREDSLRNWRRRYYRGFAKKTKSEITMEVGGWVHVSLGIIIIFLLKIAPKIALNQYCYLLLLFILE